MATSITQSGVALPHSTPRGARHLRPRSTSARAAARSRHRSGDRSPRRGAELLDRASLVRRRRGDACPAGDDRPRDHGDGPRLTAELCPPPLFGAGSHQPGRRSSARYAMRTAVGKVLTPVSRRGTDVPWSQVRGVPPSTGRVCDHLDDALGFAEFMALGRTITLLLVRPRSGRARPQTHGEPARNSPCEGDTDASMGGLSGPSTWCSDP